MLTGDGLLARIRPLGPLPIAKLLALCDAALECGNGVLEITQRGSLQVRGLSAISAAPFARRVFAMGFEQQTAPPILPSPLLGLDALETADLRPVLEELRMGFAGHPMLKQLDPKVSILLDGGGGLNLEGVSGDLRLRAMSDSRLQMSIAGAATAAIPLGTVAVRHALDVTMQVLSAIVQRGPQARGRDLANPEDVALLRMRLAAVLSAAPADPPRPAVEAIGTHRLQDGRLALGVALAFGFTEAATLQSFARLTAQHGADSIETAPGRALLVVGVQAAGAAELAMAAASRGFIVRPEDPRRFIIACAGAPACGSATLPTRLVASQFAHAAPALLDGSFHIHVSGCRKGCAHPGVAALTFVGADGLVIQGRAGDSTQGLVRLDQAIAGLARLDAVRRRVPWGAGSSAQMLSRLGVEGVLAALDGTQ
jgi:precorrin-3B synthase